MEGVFILSDYSEFLKEIINQLNLPEENEISVPINVYDSEHLWHNWVNDIFKERNIKKLIIPISLPTDNPNTLGLIIAMHIRLNYEVSEENRIFPIIFLSDLELGNIFKINEYDSDYNSQNLLFTKGVLLSNFDSDNIIDTIQKVEFLNPSDYKTQVLNRLKVSQKANEGKHSIANAWGCYKLALVTGLGDVAFRETVIANKLKTLYAKYLICDNEIFDTSRYIDLNPLQCSDKKILFIDDRADDGWTVIMKNIFKSSGENFVSVESSKYKNHETMAFHDFEGFYKECQSHIGKDWDLIIIDLRLNPENEDIDSDILLPSEFSGYKLIDEFLNKNEGYQIIISTASNKIWNVNAALNRGVTSYYIKESPEFNYSIKETKKHYENFKEAVQFCFENKFLSDFWIDTQSCKNHLMILKNTKVIDKDFISAIITFLDLAFDSLKKQSKRYPYDSSFIYYFLILEALGKQIFDEENYITKKIINNKGREIDGFSFRFRKSNIMLKEFEHNYYLKVMPGDTLISTSKRIPYNPKFHNLIDHANLKNIDPLKIVELRNNFSHPDLINNRTIAVIDKKNIIDLFNVVKKLLMNLN